MSMRKINYILSILILALCFLFWTDAAGIRPPAHIYPKTVIAVTAFLAASLFIQSIFFPKALKQGNPFQGTNWKRVIITIASTIIFLFAVNTIGFYVSSFAFLVIVTWILGDKEVSLKAISKLGVLGIVVMGIVYASFKIFLKVPTPKGILF